MRRHGTRRFKGVCLSGAVKALAGLVPDLATAPSYRENEGGSPKLSGGVVADDLRSRVATVLVLVGQDARSADRLIAEIYDRLRALAQDLLARERPDHTLQATAVVNEAYLRLAEQDRVKWRDREHFFAVAATMVRWILVDHARARNAAKRGGDRQRVTLDTGSDLAATSRPVDVLEIDEALADLSARSDRQARVVEMKFFGGLTIEQIAAALVVSTTTVENEWAVARAWLRGRFADHERSEP